MTQAELQQYLDQLLRDHPLDPLYIPRRFTALPESGSVSSDLEFRSHGMLSEREPKLEERWTGHRRIQRRLVCSCHNISRFSTRRSYSQDSFLNLPTKNATVVAM